MRSYCTWHRIENYLSHLCQICITNQTTPYSILQRVRIDWQLTSCVMWWVSSGMWSCGTKVSGSISCSWLWSAQLMRPSTSVQLITTRSWWVHCLIFKSNRLSSPSITWDLKHIVGYLTPEGIDKGTHNFLFFYFLLKKSLPHIRK